ncbi:hypothetical protein [Zhihengliuella salsuginis]|uniref:Uncharacterized protein n=1 Tax=Zhihengliuella salsuginis TaxID=578222 RepID=A0ABQ3GKI1_9MICC|nr:hypothetical protein [Zhihengliuella salsuginis]GHD09082.1 hypothetical protein GCM10008096_21380 [Zhihengliuella salsuginis]
MFEVFRGKKPFALIAALFLAITLVGPPAATASAGQLATAPTVQAEATLAPEAQSMAVWVPWDGAKISTAAKCENRRQWLIANDPDITASNSDCWDYVTSTCPPRRYWLVVVRAAYFASPAKEELLRSQDEPSALSC